MNYTDRDSLEKHIKTALKQYPCLSADGFCYSTFGQTFPASKAELKESRKQLLSECGVEQIYHAILFIRRFGVPQKHEGDSRTLKLAIEYMGRRYGGYGYVSNGGAIVAAILCGIKPIFDPISGKCHFDGGSGCWKTFEEQWNQDEGVA
jgi:hypothetical protein